MPFTCSIRAHRHMKAPDIIWDLICFSKLSWWHIDKGTDFCVLWKVIFALVTSLWGEQTFWTPSRFLFHLWNCYNKNNIKHNTTTTTRITSCMISTKISATQQNQLTKLTIKLWTMPKECWGKCLITISFYLFLFFFQQKK